MTDELVMRGTGLQKEGKNRGGEGISAEHGGKDGEHGWQKRGKGMKGHDMSGRQTGVRAFSQLSSKVIHTYIYIYSYFLFFKLQDFVVVTI